MEGRDRLTPDRDDRKNPDRERLMPDRPRLDLERDIPREPNRERLIPRDDRERLIPCDDRERLIPRDDRERLIPREECPRLIPRDRPRDCAYVSPDHATTQKEAINQTTQDRGVVMASPPWVSRGETISSMLIISH